MAFPITALFDLGSTIIKRLFPDKDEQMKKQIELQQMIQNGELKQTEIHLSAILAEAKSSDPWTSRARPSFLYVIYIMILVAIPMGILHAYNPGLATSIATGMKEWLGAIPNALWGLFGAGYLGYSASRSYDKGKLMKTLNNGLQ